MHRQTMEPWNATLFSFPGINPVLSPLCFNQPMMFLLSISESCLKLCLTIHFTLIRKKDNTSNLEEVYTSQSDPVPCL